MLTADKARAYHAAHPDEKTPIQDLLFTHDQPGFLIPPWVGSEPPNPVPAIGLTPHGVADLADILTEKLARAKALKIAQPIIRSIIVETLREMHDRCNSAFVSRLKQGTLVYRIDVTDEVVPVKYESVRNMGIETRTETHVAVRHALKTERPAGAHDPDKYQFIETMLWNDWLVCGKVLDSVAPPRAKRPVEN
jgi:hypothetical protein